MIEEKFISNKNVEAIMQLYGESILRLAYSYVHNYDDAEDILQETLIKYVSKAPVFTCEEHEKAWLITVAINQSRNSLKYNKTHQCDELNEMLIKFSNKDLSFIWEAVKSLPIKYREVIHLYYYEGYSVKQIANVLNKNEITIRSLLHRGRKKLKTILKEDYEFDETI